MTDDEMKLHVNTLSRNILSLVADYCNDYEEQLEEGNALRNTFKVGSHSIMFALGLFLRMTTNTLDEKLELVDGLTENLKKNIKLAEASKP